MAHIFLATDDVKTMNAVERCLRGTSHQCAITRRRSGSDTVKRETADCSRVAKRNRASMDEVYVLREEGCFTPFIRVILLGGRDFPGEIWETVEIYSAQFVVPKPLDVQILTDALLRAAQAAHEPCSDEDDDVPRGFVVETGPVSTLVEPARTSRRKKRVVVANDCAPIAGMVAHCLNRTCGYHAVSTPGGAETLAVLADSEGPYDLLVSDIVNPYMRGGELIEQALRRQPDLSVVIFSNIWDVMDEVLESVRRGHAGAVVPTATRPTELIWAVEEVLRLKAAGGGPVDESPQKRWLAYRRMPLEAFRRSTVPVRC